MSEEEPVEIPISDIQQAVEDAKAWFGPQEEFVVQDNLINPSAKKEARTKKIQWNKAITHENGAVIEVAMKYSAHAVPMRDDTTSVAIKEKQKESFYRLLIRKDSLGNYFKSILKFFPEQTVKDQSRLEMNNFMSLNSQFSGDIQLTDWEENLEMGWHVSEGIVVEEYFPEPNQGKKSKKLLGAALDCIVTTYTICDWSGDDDGEIIYDEDDGYYDIPGVESSGCYTVYSTSGCGDENPSGPGWSGGGGSGGSTGPGGGGGSGSGVGGLPTLYPEDEIIRKDPSFQGTNADCIFGKLLAINGFQQIAQNFEGVGSEFDVLLKIGATQSSSASGQTQWKGANQPIEITFSSPYMGRSALEISRTVIHEMLHAEFYRALNTQSPTPKDLSFKATFEQYTGQYSGSNAVHHNVMADIYVGYIADVLQQVHPQLGGAAFADYYNYPDGYPNGIPRGFYEALAWQGLKEAGVKGWSNLNIEEQTEINKHLLKAEIGRKSCN